MFHFSFIVLSRRAKALLPKEFSKVAMTKWLMCDTDCRINFVVGQYQYVVGPNQYVSNFELVQINSVKFSWLISIGSALVGRYQVSPIFTS